MIIILVDRRASPSVESHIAAKMEPRLYKASTHTGGPRDFLLSGF